MNRYMPLTGIDLIPASLLIDTQAPLDVLQAMADYRIRTVTQVLENIAFRAELGCDTVCAVGLFQTAGHSVARWL
jgi:hypothetical protein